MQHRSNQGGSLTLPITALLLMLRTAEAKREIQRFFLKKETAKDREQGVAESNHDDTRGEQCQKKRGRRTKQQRGGRVPWEGVKNNGVETRDMEREREREMEEAHGKRKGDAERKKERRKERRLRKKNKK